MFHFREGVICVLTICRISQEGLSGNTLNLLYINVKLKTKRIEEKVYVGETQRCDSEYVCTCRPGWKFMTLETLQLTRRLVNRPTFGDSTTVLIVNKKVSVIFVLPIYHF